ncbi:Hypothetical predicted protein [Pelobates cultripes]|uniref:Uncharacterized protein n=1 Tax=Pelobates cultripes TaxID=61616 RepID=A0AAD1QYG2_PELCU|nr:Hypothetical predicted protein [Pelobates cultripes]
MRQPPSPAPSEDSGDEADIRAILTQLPSKKDLTEMFQKLENSFSEKLQAVTEDAQHLGTRVQTLEDAEETNERLWMECHTTQNQHTDAIVYLQRKFQDVITPELLFIHRSHSVFGVVYICISFYEYNSFLINHMQ